MAERMIRCAEIEYQPDFHHPSKPFPLGVVVEERLGGRRRVILIGGKIPGGSASALGLEGAWGPFNDIVMNWFETFSRGIDELIKKADRNAFVVDGLAEQWRSNVYLKQPEVLKGTPSKSLDVIARDYYEAFVGEKPPLPSERTQAKDVRFNYMERATV